MQWNIGKKENYGENQPVVKRHQKKAVVIWRKGEKVFVFDQKCPHEGYPLSLGEVNESCELTCHWHHWRFDLNSGENLYGGDHLPVYPTLERDGEIWVDMTPPSKEVLTHKYLSHLRQAREDRDYGWMVRLLTQWDLAELDPHLPLIDALVSTRDLYEYGTTHAFPAAHDWWLCSQNQDLSKPIQIACRAEALDIIANDTLREEKKPFADGQIPFHGEVWVRMLIEEQEQDAIKMARQAMLSGLTFNDLMPYLEQAILRHYLGFGHPMIYLHKSQELINHWGPALYETILFNLIRRICHSTKEDLIPDFKDFEPALRRIEGRPAGQQHNCPELGLGQSTAKVLGWVVDAWTSYSPESIWEKLLLAAADNTTFFDATWGFRTDQGVQDNVDWLDFTHGMTFAEAVRKTCLSQPRLWQQGLLQMACFVGRNAKYLNLNQTFELGPEIKIEDFIDHGIDPPIFPAHLIKTWCAIQNMKPLVSQPKRLEQALQRFIKAPIRQKRVMRTVNQAIKLLEKT